MNAPANKLAHLPCIKHSKARGRPGSNLGVWMCSKRNHSRHLVRVKGKSVHGRTLQGRLRTTKSVPFFFSPPPGTPDSLICRESKHYLLTIKTTKQNEQNSKNHQRRSKCMRLNRRAYRDFHLHEGLHHPRRQEEEPRS